MLNEVLEAVTLGVTPDICGPQVPYRYLKCRQQEALERWRRQEAEEAEARRFEELVRQVGRWRQAHEIQVYVKTVKARAKAQRGTNKARLKEWAAWALRHAERIDPIASLDDFEGITGGESGFSGQAYPFGRMDGP